MTERSRIGAGLVAAVMVVTVSGCGLFDKDDEKTAASSVAPSVSTSATSTAPSSATTSASAPSSAAAGSAAPTSGSTTSTSQPSSSPVIAPVTKNVSELSGTTVQLTVGGVLNINTGDQAVTSYRGEVSDQSVAEYLQGRDDGTARFNPGVKALGPGSTTVTLTSKAGGAQPVTFTVAVVG